MPKLINLTPKYRKHKQSGQAIVTLNGRDHLLGPHGTKASRREYDRLIAEWLQRGRQPLILAGADLTLAELGARYWDFSSKKHVRNGKPTPELYRVKGMLQHVLRLYEDRQAGEFSPRELKVVRQSMVDAGWSRSYVNTQTGVLVRMFKWGAVEGMVPASIHATLVLVDGLRRGEGVRETNPILPVDDATVDATLPHLPPIVADMVRLQRLTGCRPAEVCMLRPCDLDRADDVWRYRPERHKTQHHGLERIILIGPKAQEVLLRYLARASEAYCFRPCDSMEKHYAAKHAARVTPLSCGNKPGSNRRARPRKAPGERYEVDTYRRAISRACDKAFPHAELSAIQPGALTVEQRAQIRTWQSDHRWAPNQLRHAAATEVRRVFGLEAAQVVLGHAKASTTEIYAERDMAKAMQVARAIG